MSFFATTITPKTTVQSLLVNRPTIKQATQLIASVRAMGTATYIALGGIDQQEKRLTFVRDYLAISVTPSNKFFDPTKIFCISDTSDAVIEILGESYEDVR